MLLSFIGIKEPAVPMAAAHSTVALFEGEAVADDPWDLPELSQGLGVPWAGALL